ncbi:MAG: helix-turn-helix transcriptional regulator [Hyphomicrobium sp.]|nr:helix-turn-helix transcriptional regulator [Hyphomicrobium sp.]
MPEIPELQLNKRAATQPSGQRPLWLVGDGVSTFAGVLNRNQLHSHSVPVLLTGIYGSFRFRSEFGSWLTCRTALVPAGVAYEFDMRGEPLSVIYLEPTLAGAGALAPLIENAIESGGTLYGASAHVPALRSMFEDQSSAAWVEAALLDFVQFAAPRARRRLDPRVTRAVQILSDNRAENISAHAAAKAVGLSASRFQHVFTDEVGVPYRRYRAWQRMLHAIREIVSGANLTTAAHAAGFADQAHFGREFRRTFGAPPSIGIANVRG